MLVNILNICSDDELMSDSEEQGETEGRLHVVFTKTSFTCIIIVSRGNQKTMLGPS